MGPFEPSPLTPLADGQLAWREWIAAAWFGPKGFASVLYALIILRSGIAGAEEIFHLAAVAIALSMLLHRFRKRRSMAAVCPMREQISSRGLMLSISIAKCSEICHDEPE